jgi:hypothetical protein
LRQPDEAPNHEVVEVRLAVGIARKAHELGHNGVDVRHFTPGLTNSSRSRALVMAWLLDRLG